MMAVKPLCGLFFLYWLKGLQIRFYMYVRARKATQIINSWLLLSVIWSRDPDLSRGLCRYPKFHTAGIWNYELCCVVDTRLPAAQDSIAR